jgi:hypothetical protein
MQKYSTNELNLMIDNIVTLDNDKEKLLYYILEIDINNYKT